MKRIKIMLIDDNQKFRESLKELLLKKYDFEIIAEAENGKEFLNLKIEDTPDVILMDLSMPELNGYDATKFYFWNFPKSKIIAVTASDEIAYLDRLIEVGFKGCVFKSNIYNEIYPAIESVLSGKLWFRNINIQ